MNIFEKLSISREIIINEGEIALDKQRIVFLPVPFIGLLLIKLKQNISQKQKIYKTMKSGAAEWAVPLGKQYGLAYKDFLDRWIKYTAFGGWGLTEYQLIEEDKGRGFLRIKDLSLHKYLKKKGINEPSDFIFESITAGSLSGSFNLDIDVLEVKCICAGDDFCVFYWGPRSYLIQKFPKLALDRFGDTK